MRKILSFRRCRAWPGNVYWGDDPVKPAGRLTAIYLLAALVWVGGSDWLFSTMFPQHFAVISLYKGWAFVVVTAGLLYSMLVREFQQRDSVEKQLRSMAVRDPLTGLLNRASFAEQLERAVARAKRHSLMVGLIFIDLDGFKSVNDAHGHHVGDELLKEASHRLTSLIRAGDVAARFGGDEFVVMVQGEPGKDDIRSLCQRLLEVMRKPFLTAAGEVSLTASIGYARFPEDAEEGELLLRAADLAMYRAKSHGKNVAMTAAAEPVG